VDVGAVSHIGKVRDANEDAYVVCRAGRFLERLLSNLPESVLAQRFEEPGYILLVADGMGGMAAGDVASHTALTTIIQLVLNAPKWALKLDDPATREAEIREMWERARGYLAGVHAAIRRRAASDPSLAGMGTTLTGAYSVGADLFVLHVGDSRAYLFRGGRVQRITRDHNLAQSYVDLGILRAGDVEAHRLRHILTRAVGGPDEEVHGDLHALRLAHGDRLLLCTDGLTNLVDEEEMAEVLGTSGSSQEACQKLVDLALDYGGTDNVTAIVASYAVSEGVADAYGSLA
jgi:protein phosphatase